MVLIASVPGHCLTFTVYTKSNVLRHVSAHISTFIFEKTMDDDADSALPSKGHQHRIDIIPETEMKDQVQDSNSNHGHVEIRN